MAPGVGTAQDSGPRGLVARSQQLSLKCWLPLGMSSEAKVGMGFWGMLELDCGHVWVPHGLFSGLILGPRCCQGLEVTDDSQWDSQPRLSGHGGCPEPKGAGLGKLAFGQHRDGVEKAPTVCVAWLGDRRVAGE